MTSPHDPTEPISDLSELLRSLRPVLHEGVYVFTVAPPGQAIAALQPLATFHELEGLTLIVEEEAARRADLPILLRAAWITLEVHSDLQAVGLTAAVAAALTQAGISCNVVAAAYHDHIFVPVAAAPAAVAALRALQDEAAGGG